MGILQLIQHAPAHTVAPATFQAAYDHAVRAYDTTMLAVLAGRLDLPTPIADKVAAVKAADVRSAWTARPDQQARAAMADDVLAGETRTSVLATMLEDATSDIVIAAVASAFATKPVKGLAHAFLRRKLTDIPADIAGLVIQHGTGGPNPVEMKRHRLNASLPYNGLHTPTGKGAPKWGLHMWTLTQLARPGIDPSNGADLTAYMRAQTDKLTTWLRQHHDGRRDAVADIIASAVAYKASGRPLPQGAYDELDHLQAQLTAIQGPNGTLAASLHSWTNAGRPDLDTTSKSYHPFRSTLTDVRDLTGQPLRPLSDFANTERDLTSAIKDLASEQRTHWAAATTNPEDLAALHHWATQTPLGPNGGTNSGAGAVRYALLTNPTLPTPLRNHLIAELHDHATEHGTYPVLPNPHNTPATHTLTQLTGRDRLALHIAGSSAHTPTHDLTPEDQATALRAYTAATGAGLLTNRTGNYQQATIPDIAATALRDLITHPDTHPDTLNHLPWPYVVQGTAHGHPHHTLRQTLTTWLLARTTTIAGTDPTLWQLIDTLMPNDTTAHPTTTVGDLLTVAATSTT